VKFKIFFSTILFLSLILTNASFALGLYDDFSGTYIDKNKWRQTDWVREIDPGSQRLLIKQASPSPVAISTYPYHDTNNLNFSDPNSVNSIQALSSSSQYTLTINKSGAGTGTVTSSPAGINCGSDCTEDFKVGTKITLKAKADTNSTFTGWSGGGCSGTGTCAVIMNADIAVTTAFSAKTPDISVPSSSLNFGSVNVGKKITKTLKIANNGSGDLFITLSGLEGTDFSIQGSSSVTIKGKKSYSLKVLCTPTSAGLKTATLEIHSNDADTPTLEISLTAVLPATTPDISVAQTSLDFGSVKLGKKATKTLKIGNNGTGDLMITLSGLEGTDFSIQGSSSVTIKAKKSYSLRVVFMPESAGSETATLRITSNDPDTPILDTPLSGGPPDTIPPSVPQNLSAIAVSSNQINLTWNASSDNVGVKGYKTYKGGVYLKSVTGTSTSDTGLNANTQYCYTVSAYDAVGNESEQSSQACATTPKPEIIVDPITLSFGSAPVGRESTPWEVKVSNGGTGYLIIGTVNLGGANPDQFSKVSDGCSSQSLASTESCTVRVSFRPTSVGEKSATLVIPSNDTDKTSVTVTLSGVEGETLGRFRLSTRGLWVNFEHRGWPTGYPNGDTIQDFNNFDSAVGHTVAEEVALQLDKMRAMGVNTIVYELRAADPIYIPGPFVPPVCNMGPSLGFQWPQPTPTELSNFVAFLDMIYSKGIRVMLILNNTHMEEQPPTNAQTWLGAIIGTLKGHPAIDLICFGGNMHVIDTNADGIPDACGIPAEPPLYMGPTYIGSQYVKWAINYGLSLGIPAQKLSAEAIVGDFFTISQPTNSWATDGHMWSPIVTLKKIFDDLKIPDSERTYVLSFFEHRKCVSAQGLPCPEDADLYSWADQIMQSEVFATIGTGNGARVFFAEMGKGSFFTPVDPTPTERVLEHLIVLLEKYGIDGGSFYRWTSFSNDEDTDPQQSDPVKRRGIEFIYNPVQKEVIDMGGFHLTTIPNGSFETGDSLPSNWTVGGNGTGLRYFLPAEPGQPEVPTRGNYALRLVTGSGPNDTVNATSDMIAVTPNTIYTTTANLRFGWTGDPSPAGDSTTRPQVFISIQYFDGSGKASQVRTQDVFRFYQENSTNAFQTFPLQYTTPTDASFVRIEVDAARNGLPTAITFDVDNLR
jgi:hypothetical protein